MTCILNVSSEAEDDLFEAWEWYEEQQLGLGDRFENAFFEKVNLLLNNPLHYPKKGKYRVATIQNFPYLIIYKYVEQSQTVLVLAVFHTSRHPKRKPR